MPTTDDEDVCVKTPVFFFLSSATEQSRLPHNAHAESISIVSDSRTKHLAGLLAATIHGLNFGDTATTVFDQTFTAITRRETKKEEHPKNKTERKKRGTVDIPPRLQQPAFPRSFAHLHWRLNGIV